jgi:hypothetical protein
LVGRAGKRPAQERVPRLNKREKPGGWTAGLLHEWGRTLTSALLSATLVLLAALALSALLATALLVLLTTLARLLATLLLPTLLVLLAALAWLVLPALLLPATLLVLLTTLARLLVTLLPAALLVLLTTLALIRIIHVRSSLHVPCASSQRLENASCSSVGLRTFEAAASLTFATRILVREPRATIFAGF